MKSIAVFVFCAFVFFQSEGKQFTRCDLVRELRSQGFPEAKMRDWVCLIENESSRTTTKNGRVNKNGSRDYGLFQINDKYWCSNTSTKGKDCNVTCTEVTTDDISKASTCAKKVFNRHGFNAWYGWKNNCQSGLPDISSCQNLFNNLKD